MTDANSDIPDASLSSHRWLITGAAGSIGGALAEMLAQRGATLVLLDKNKRALEQLADRIETAGGEPPYLFPIDLGGAGPEDYQRLAESLQAHLQRLHGVVHACAHFEGLAPLDQMPLGHWWVGLQANLSAPLMLTRELLPLLEAGAAQHTDGASLPVPQLIFLLDTLERTAEAFWGAYGVAQWGLHGMVQQLASECSNRPLDVRGIVLPAFHSTLRARAFPAEAPDSLPMAPAVAAALCKMLQEKNGTDVIDRLCLETHAA